MESTRAGAMRLCPGRVPLPLGPGLCGINANFRECYLAEAQFPRISLIGSRVNRGNPPLCNPPRGEKAHELALYSCGLRKGGEQGPSLPLLYASHMAPTRWLHRRVLPLRDG